MIRILFVCHGNICRSPMAEFVLKDIIHQRNLDDYLHIESAATSSEELGNPIHPGTLKMLKGISVDCSNKRARRITQNDYNDFDLLIGMDDVNIRNMRRIWSNDPQGKVYKLLEFAGQQDDIADTWYTGNFTETYDDVVAGCTGLLSYLKLI